MTQLRRAIGYHAFAQARASRSSPVLLSAVTSEAPSHTSGVAVGLGALPRSILDGGEIVILAIKPSMWRPLFNSGPWLVTCCLLATMLIWLGRPLPGLSLTATAQLVLSIGLLRVGLALVHWVPTWYLLTNRRIIDVHGVRKPQVSACSLIDVRNTCVTVSPAERLTRLGTITFIMDHEETSSHVWQSVADPEDVHARIRRAIESAIDQLGV